MINKELWQKHQPPHNPFLNYEFLNALLESGSIGAKSGWTPAIQDDENGILFSFIKDHSYGEYIFDWSWAEAFERYGIPYYPKLTSMLPFTPVTTQHFLLKEFSEEKAMMLLKKHDHFFMTNDFSSSHFLFLSQEEISIFEQCDYIIRESMQYHFHNLGYTSFENFLDKLKTKKAKNIRHERSFSGLTIKQYTGDELTADHARRMYQFYIATIVNKNSFNYLNEKFFELIFRDLKKNILYVEASNTDGIIAGSLFFYDDKTLYGRYWGSNTFVENLHFELCYYQGIDFCIKKNIEVFEAGAQGEHKIARGFRPIRTYSAHKIKHPGFNEAIANFILEEKKQVKINIEKLSEYLPFRELK